MRGTCTDTFGEDTSKEEQFNIVLLNPCYDARTLQAPDDLYNQSITYLIRSGTISRNNFMDTFSLKVPLCGGISFNLYDEEDISLDTSYLK